MENTKFTKETEDIINCSFKLRKLLEQSLPKELVDYILYLIAKDLAHKKYLDIVKD